MKFKIGDMVYYQIGNILSLGIITKIDFNRLFSITVYFQNPDKLSSDYDDRHISTYEINGRFYPNNKESDRDIKLYNLKNDNI